MSRLSLLIQSSNPGIGNTISLPDNAWTLSFGFEQKCYHVNLQTSRVLQLGNVGVVLQTASIDTRSVAA